MKRLLLRSLSFFIFIFILIFSFVFVFVFAYFFIVLAVFVHLLIVLRLVWPRRSTTDPSWATPTLKGAHQQSIQHGRHTGCLRRAPARSLRVQITSHRDPLSCGQEFQVARTLEKPVASQTKCRRL